MIVVGPLTVSRVLLVILRAILMGLPHIEGPACGSTWLVVAW